MSKEQLAEQLELFIMNNFDVNDYDLILKAILSYLYEVEDKVFDFQNEELDKIIDGIQELAI